MVCQKIVHFIDHPWSVMAAWTTTGRMVLWLCPGSEEQPNGTCQGYRIGELKYMRLTDSGPLLFSDLCLPCMWSICFQHPYPSCWQQLIENDPRTLPWGAILRLTSSSALISNHQISSCLSWYSGLLLELIFRTHFPISYPREPFL